MIRLVIRGSDVTRITSSLPLCWLTISATAMAPEPLPGPAPAIHDTFPLGAHCAPAPSAVATRSAATSATPTATCVPDPWLWLMLPSLVWRRRSRRADLVLALLAPADDVAALAGPHEARLHRMADDLGQPARDRDQRVEVHAGLDPHLVQHVHHVLGGDVAGGPRRVGAAAQAADGAVEPVDADLERREDVRRRHAARVVQVQAEVDVGKPVAQARQPVVDEDRVRHARGVRHADLADPPAHVALDDPDQAFRR